MKPIVAIEIIPALLILLFAYTAVSKFIDHESFRAVLKTITGGNTGADVLSLLVPTGEIGIVLLLFFSKTRLMGMYASLVLLALFTVYLIYMVLFVPHLPCSCGGVIGKMSWREHVVFNMVFLGITAVSIRSIKRKTMVKVL